MSGLVDDLRDRFMAAQLSGDPRAALRIVGDECAVAGLSPPQILVEIVQAAQVEIGRRWHRAGRPLDEQIIGTEIAQLAIAFLDARMPPARHPEDGVLIACVEGERHELGGRIIATLLEMQGHEVHLAGPDVPTDSLLDLVSLRRPHVVGLSVTLPALLPSVRETVARLSARFGSKITIAIGGSAAHSLDARTLDGGARVITSDGIAAIDALDALDTAPHPAHPLGIDQL